MTDKRYIKGLLEEINICDQIISKYEELTNGYKYQIKILNNKYRKAFERLKSQQREIDRLKKENESFENNMKSVLEIEKKQDVKEFAQKIKDGVADYLYKTNFDGRKENVVDMFELCEIVDSTVKEYEKCGADQKE